MFCRYGGLVRRREGTQRISSVRPPQAPFESRVVSEPVNGERLHGAGPRTDTSHHQIRELYVNISRAPQVSVSLPTDPWVVTSSVCLGTGVPDPMINRREVHFPFPCNPLNPVTIRDTSLVLSVPRRPLLLPRSFGRDLGTQDLHRSLGRYTLGPPAQRSVSPVTYVSRPH